MEYIQKESEYNQYWFYVSTPEYTICPYSSGCNDDNTNPNKPKSRCKKMNKRMVGISTPTKLDLTKKYKYILNNDFNIDGKANDWYCGKNDYPVWGGIISGACASDKRYLMKNIMDLFIKFIKEDYIIIHLSLTYEDTYYNQPPCDNKLDKNCDVTIPCKKYWYPNNPDQQYLEKLFNLIYKNAFPAPLNNLKVSYDDLALFGYSVGAGAVSRYINEFPLMKTKPDNYNFPLIKSAVMVAGGSLYCYSAIFSPCFDTNVNIRGCCPSTLSEPNFDNGVIPWSQHPPVIIIQSSDDSYADPMAGTYYYNVMVKNNVPAKKVIDDTTIHGISSENQINSIIDWVKEKYSHPIPTSNKTKNIKSSSSKVPQITFTIVTLVIVAVLFILVIKNYKNNSTYSIIAGVFLCFVVIMLIVYLFLSLNKKVTKSNKTHKDIDSLNILQKQMLLNGKPSRVTAGELFDKVVQIKDQIYTDYPNIGGVLVHLAELEGLKDIINKPNFEFNLSSGGESFMTDCSMVGQNKQNCSAWTYLRKDLPPMVYSYPSSPAGPAPFWTPSIGFIVDPSRIWPIINTMGIVDSATDSRNCGSQDSSYLFNIFDVNNGMGRCNPDVYNSKGDKLKPNEHCIFQSSNTSVGCNTECSYEKDIVNTNCRFKNSGASLHNYTWATSDYPGFSWDCPNKDDRYGWNDPNFPNGVKSCYKAVEINWDDISPEDQALLNSNGYGKSNKSSYQKWAKFIPAEDCYLTSPTLYQTNDTNSAGQIGKSILGTNMEVSSKDRNYYYIGENENSNNGGATFQEQTWKNCDFQNGATAENCKIDPATDKNIPISVNNIITKQAKWLKKDWGRWIIELKKVWKYIYSTMDKTGYKNKSAYIDGNDYDPYYGFNYDYNYLYGNPCNTGDWWENEVNIYINDEMAKDENSDLNNLFRNSMIGAFYIGKTCEDFVSDLPSGTNLSNQGQPNCKFDNGVERCVGYLCNYKVDKTNPLKSICETPLGNASKTTYADVKAEEKKRMEMGKDAITSFVEKFNNKYRKGMNKINGYKLMTTSNAFPSWVSLDKVFKGELKGSDVFVPI